MSHPVISVVVPAYNTAPFIADTLSSVFSQTITDFEIIVVNDGSPDTPELERAIAPYRERIRYVVQENKGLSAARNTAIAIARGSLIALLDSDDVWEPEYLAHQLEVMRRDELAVVYPDATTFGDPMRAGRRFMDMHPSSGEVTFEALVSGRCNVMVSVLARKDVLVAAGLFDESLRSSEDFDMWLRIAHAGWRIGYHRRSLVGSRLRAGSLSANPISMCQHIVRVFDKAMRELPLTQSQRALVVERRAHFAALLRMHEGKRAFFAGDARTAIDALSEANLHLRRRKLAAAVMAIRVMPGLLLRAYDWRDRFVFKASTR
ncbi:MAG TPA: glycosyltransferase family A protein [Vicinamibacterales bacterium]